MTGYPTPEEAALSSYSDAPGAFVVHVVKEAKGRAEVWIDTVPSHPYYIRCEQARDGLWYERGGHN